MTMSGMKNRGTVSRDADYIAASKPNAEAKKLMYYAPGAEQMVYLVWEMQNERPTLAGHLHNR